MPIHRRSFRVQYCFPDNSGYRFAVLLDGRSARHRDAGAVADSGPATPLARRPPGVEGRSR